MSRVVFRTAGGNVTAAEVHPAGARALRELHEALRAAEAEGVLDAAHAGPQLLPALDELVPLLRVVGEDARPEDNPAAPDEHRRNATWWRDKLGRAEKVLGEVADALGLPRASSYEWLPDAAREKLRALTDPEPCCDGEGYCREHNPGGRLP